MQGIRIAVLCTVSAMAAGAQAQTTVTLSGILDLAMRQVNNQGVGSMKSLVSGSNATSRLIFSGQEDLGGRLYAGFHLEHGLLADVGTQAAADKFFDRRSTVSLGSKDWGELRLGRDFVAPYTNWSRYDPFAYVGAARTANLVSATPNGPIRSAFGSNANTTVRSDNLVQWLAPSGWGGFEGGLMLAAPEGGAVASGQAKMQGARLGYDAKVWSVSAATATSQNSQTTASKFKDNAIGGTLTLEPVRLSAAWREFKYDQSKQTLLLLGAVATFGQHEWKASWTKANMKGRVGTTPIDANDATQIGLGYVYNLSKRTALYGTLARVSNDGAARFVITDGPAGMAGGGTSKGFEFGVRHRF